MRDIIVFSNIQITKESCEANLKQSINHFIDNGKDLMINSKNRLYLHFSNQRINEPMDDSSEELQEIIPINNAFLTFIETYRSIDAKRVIEVLLSIFEDLYVYIDDIDWHGKAQDFLNTSFDF